jgi:hypothetical protein
MSERRAPESIASGEMKIRAVNPDSGSKLKIVSRKN